MEDTVQGVLGKKNCWNCWTKQKHKNVWKGIRTKNQQIIGMIKYQALLFKQCITTFSLICEEKWIQAIYFEQIIIYLRLNGITVTYD